MGFQTTLKTVELSLQGNKSKSYVYTPVIMVDCRETNQNIAVILVPVDSMNFYSYLKLASFMNVICKSLMLTFYIRNSTEIHSKVSMLVHSYLLDIFRKEFHNTLTVLLGTSCPPILLTWHFFASSMKLIFKNLTVEIWFRLVYLISFKAPGILEHKLIYI